MALVASSGTLMLYLICCLGLFRLRVRNVATVGGNLCAGEGVSIAEVIALFRELAGRLRQVLPCDYVALVLHDAATGERIWQFDSTPARFNLIKWLLFPLFLKSR